MKKNLFLFAFLFAFIISNAQVVPRMLSTNRHNDSLWVTDTSTFTIVNRIRLTPSSGGAIEGTLGMARNPNTGTVFLACNQFGVTGRMLGKLDLSTNIVTMVGNLGDKFSSITFRGDSLFGVTGNGGTVPESLFLIDTATAATTFLRALGSGTDGEIICYNPAHDLIYHWSGNVTVEFESILPYPPYTVTPIVSSTTISNETFGAVYISADKFLCSNLNYIFDYWSTAGTFQYANSDTTWELARGMAFISCSRNVSAAATAFCPGDSSLLTASTSPSYQWYRNGIAISGATAQTFFAKLRGDYNCQVSDECGMDTCLTGTHIIPFTSPVVTISGNTNLCPGGTVTLTGTAGGSAQWYVNGALIPGATAHTYVVNATGVYNMTKTNASGCKDSAATGATVMNVGNPVVSIGPDTAQCGSYLLNAGNSGASYLWSTTATTQTLSVTATGVYFVRVTDANGCKGNDTASITIHPLPFVSVTAASDTLCDSDVPETLSGSPSGGIFSGTGVTGNSFDPLAGAGSYVIYYAYSDSLGCSATDSMDMYVDICTGIAAADGMIVSVFPNPASDKVNINAAAQIEMVQVYDITGRIVLEERAAGYAAVLDVAALKNGLYTIKARNAKGESAVLISVQH